LKVQELYFFSTAIRHGLRRSGGNDKQPTTMRNTMHEMITTADHVRQCYHTPQQIGACDRAGINAAIFDQLRGRTSITQDEAVGLVRAVLAKEYPGRNILAAWKFVSYEGANTEAGQVAILMGTDPTIYTFPQGSAILAQRKG